MGGFLSDILGAGRDLFTSTFDPKYGWLGRPASGALRSGIDFARALPGQVQPAVAPWLNQYGPMEELGGDEFTKFLDENLGSSIGRKLIGEPTQQVAESMLGVDYGREVPTGELFRSAIFPDISPADVEPTIREPGPGFSLGEERLKPQEELESVPEMRHQLGGAVESSGNLLEIAPEIAAIPAVPGLGLAFLPGIAEGLGTNLGEGEYGKAAIDALFLTGIGKHAAGEFKAEPVSESKMPRGEDTFIPPDRGADWLGVPSEQLFPGEVRGARIHNMATGALERIRDRSAELLGVPELRDARLVPEVGSGGARYDAESQTIRYDPERIAQSPELLAHELAHSVADHKFPTTWEGEAFYDLGHGKAAEVPISLDQHTEPNIGARAAIHPEEHQFQTAMDSLKNDPQIAEVINTFRTNLEGVKGELPPESRLSEPVGERETSAPELPKEPTEWRVTFNDGSTKFVKAADRGEAAKIAKTEGLPEGATKIAGISERTPEMTEGRREGIRKNETTFKVTLSDGTSRKVRAYSEDSARSIVSKAQESIGTSVKVTGVEEWTKKARTQSEPVTEGIAKSEPVEETGKPPAKRIKLTPQEIENLGKVLGGMKTESPEVAQAREAVVNAIMGKKDKPAVSEAKKAVKEAGGEPISPETPGTGEGGEKVVPFKVTLSDGSEHIVKSTTAGGARADAEKTLKKHGSTKTVDNVEEHYTGLEKAAREEVDEVKVGKEEAAEELKETRKETKEKTLEEKAFLAEEERLRKAQTKEKLAKKAYTVTLSDGSKHTVRARSEERARQLVEDRIRANKSKKKVAKVEEKVSRLEKTLKESPAEQVSKLEKGLIDDLTDIPKTLKFAFDVSWPGRQGLFLLNRPEALKGMVKGTATVVPFKGRELHERIKTELANRPNAELYEKFGLNQYKYDPTEITKYSERMEEIPSERAAKLPGVRHSTRAFEDAGNLARANMFDEFDRKFREAGKSPETNPELYKGMADYLNVLTMRKPLPEKLQHASWLLNKMFVSPMAFYSRLQLINPSWYGKLPPEMKRAAARDIGGTSAVLIGLAGAATIAAVQAGFDPDDVSMSLDPANTDFLRLKVGNTYYDYLTGVGGIIRTLYRVTTGRKVTRTGEKRIKGSIFTPDQDLPESGTAWDEIKSLGENRLAPVARAFKGITTGKGWYGEDYGFATMLKDLFLPLSMEDPIEAGSRYGAVEAIKQSPGIVGVGTQLDRSEGEEESGLELPF